MRLLLSCEHGGNRIPKEYSGHFNNFGEILNSHRGFDPGALDLFKFLIPLSNFSCFSTTSRLLVELNRSLYHPNLFSEFTRGLSTPEKKKILEDYYFPYRKKVENAVIQYLGAGEKVLHLSVHSFTPVLNGTVRNADIGLLYDPARVEEKLLAGRWKENLKIIAPQLKVRLNYPYKGTADGFTTYLRRRFPANYIGIELEVNQQFSGNNKMSNFLKETLYFILQEEKKRKQKE